MKKGDRVTCTGRGRTMTWGWTALSGRPTYPVGTVTRRHGRWIYVRWDTSTFEDEMGAAEVRLVDAPEQPVELAPLPAQEPPE